ncbi:hypothetical protein A7C91_04875 [Thermococcus piezophilus]|uniref:Uncharacterized protein n=1 Tax=Thermococcus piezophilus TaxID=1712654 RepID=A0A172WGL1_9EURY|nr:hypothetical protein A7C91_04875 [Thermococcus piezophilus]
MISFGQSLRPPYLLHSFTSLQFNEDQNVHEVEALFNRGTLTDILNRRLTKGLWFTFEYGKVEKKSRGLTPPAWVE